MPKAKCARLLVGVLDGYCFSLPSDPRLALLKLSDYISSMETKDREVPSSTDKRRVPLGYWQTADWVYGLMALGAEAERVATQPRSSS
jgi:hypothetical protein